MKYRHIEREIKRTGAMEADSREYWNKNSKRLQHFKLVLLIRVFQVLFDIPLLIIPLPFQSPIHRNLREWAIDRESQRVRKANGLSQEAIYNNM